jgi:hypothetical protein
MNFGPAPVIFYRSFLHNIAPGTILTGKEWIEIQPHDVSAHLSLGFRILPQFQE